MTRAFDAERQQHMIVVLGPYRTRDSGPAMTKPDCG